MKVSILPKTAAGKWSLWLITAFIVLFVSFLILVATGQRGGERFFDNLPLSLPIMLAGICGIASFFAGLIGVIKFRERSILVFAAMIIGLFIIFFAVGEIAFPH